MSRPMAACPPAISTKSRPFCCPEHRVVGWPGSSAQMLAGPRRRPLLGVVAWSEPTNLGEFPAVGTRGAGKHAGTVLGSTSLELVETAGTPITVVPLGEE